MTEDHDLIQCTHIIRPDAIKVGAKGDQGFRERFAIDKPAIHIEPDLRAGPIHGRHQVMPLVVAQITCARHLRERPSKPEVGAPITEDEEKLKLLSIEEQLVACSGVVALQPELHTETLLRVAEVLVKRLIK